METSTAPQHFIQSVIDEDLASGKHKEIVTRFPPHPNGYLHIGHSQSIWLNFTLAKVNGGRCHLRFDDTNPEREEPEYIQAIQDDIRWLGFDWGDHLYWCSDYFQQLYDWAIAMIKEGKAYVCDLTPEQVREYRGTLTEPGRDSPYRDRSVEENLDLFARMKAGEFEDGSKTLRAKIDMASPNLNFRDPFLYRIRSVEHHRTGKEWCIYPMYDFSHGQSDALENITHSICTLEFANHRPLYDWFLENLDVPSKPRQYEFARLNVYYTITSKRKLLELVTEGIVKGWDDPRMPTIRALRRRGYTPESVRMFCEKAGITRKDTWAELSLLEQCLRDDLNTKVSRVLGVLDPLKVVITNYPEDKEEHLRAPYFPDEPEKMGYRDLPFCKELYIERADFMEEPVKKFRRLAPGREVRLRRAYYITCQEIIKNEQGEITELRCTYDPETLGGAPDGRKVKGTIHWVSARHALDAEVRLYDRLFLEERPDNHKDKDYKEFLNPDSLKVVQAKVEPGLATTQPGDRYQFERTGFFSVDPDSKEGALVFNRAVTLKDTWAKMMKRKKQGG